MACTCTSVGSIWGSVPIHLDWLDSIHSLPGERESAFVQDVAALQTGWASEAVDRRHWAQACPEPVGWNWKHQASASKAGAVHGEQALPQYHRYAGRAAPVLRVTAAQMDLWHFAYSPLGWSLASSLYNVSTWGCRWFLFMPGVPLEHWQEIKYATSQFQCCVPSLSAWMGVVVPAPASLWWAHTLGGPPWRAWPGPAGFLSSMWGVNHWCMESFCLSSNEKNKWMIKKGFNTWIMLKWS